METAAVKKFAPSRYEDAIPCVNQLVTNVVPVNHPPIDRKAHGKRSSPDHPMNTNRSRFNQSSRLSNHPVSVCCSVEAVSYTHLTLPTNREV